MSITLIESTACIVASLILGCILGYVVQILLMSSMVNALEFEFDYSVDLKMMSIIILISLITVIVGTHLSTLKINRLKITAILKGD